MDITSSFVYLCRREISGPHSSFKFLCHLEDNGAYAWYIKPGEIVTTRRRSSTSNLPGESDALHRLAVLMQRR
jgi:hypothetical protein